MLLTYSDILGFKGGLTRKLLITKRFFFYHPTSWYNEKCFTNVMITDYKIRYQMISRNWLKQCQNRFLINFIKLSLLKVYKTLCKICRTHKKRVKNFQKVCEYLYPVSSNLLLSKKKMWNRISRISKF